MAFTANEVLTAAELNTFAPSTKIENAVGSAASPSYTFTGDTNTGMSAATGDKLAFSTAGSQRVTIDASGNVGIGIVAPEMPLHIATAASTSTELLRLTGSWNSANELAYIVGETSTDGAVLSAIGLGTAVDGSNNNDGGIAFLTTSAADTTLANLDTSMVLNHEGFLGIGNTSPASRIDITAAGSRAFKFERANDVGSSAVTLGIMKIGTDSDNPGTNDYWILFRQGSDSTIGSIKGTGSASVNFATTSDMTLKTDNGLVTAERVGSIMDTLQVHDFNWNEGTVANQIGLFAQEAIDILPQSIVDAPSVQVATEEEDELYIAASLDYSKIVPILIAECQFLRQRVEALEAA